MRSKILRRPRPCDSPRAGIRPPTLGSAVGQRGCASAETARGDGIDPDRWRDSVDWPATATTGGQPADRLRCNIAPADAVAGKAARTLSTGRDAVGNTLGLAWEKNGDILELGPREVLLPKVKPRREASTSHRGVFIALQPPAGGPQTGPHHFIAGTTSRPPLARKLARPSPRSTRRALGPLKAQNWHPHSPLLTGQSYDPVLSPEQIAQLKVTGEAEPFDGSAQHFRIGVEAHRLGLAYEYDPYFSLSIARVDPLPHQLEAVYGYFLKLPRIRFLLADDPGAGKTIMAGLLLKELKARGLVRRTLIVTPANLSFQWQRELKDKFRENFEVIRSDVLRANYGQNPWQDRDQVVTSISWVSRVEDARESLLRSRWDLIIVDEAHKMAAYAGDKKTLAYQLGEQLSEMTDHFLLDDGDAAQGRPGELLPVPLPARQGRLRQHQEPPGGDAAERSPVLPAENQGGPGHLPRPGHRDGPQALHQARGEDRRVRPRRRRIRLLRRPDPLRRRPVDPGLGRRQSPAGRAVGFTMAMLQRRMASTIYAVRRTLERMRDRREKILADPEAYRKQQIERRVPDDFDELPEDEQQEIIAQLEDVVASVDPAALRDEIARLTRLIDQARILEKRDIESKLTKLKSVLKDQGFFSDPKKKLLLFTEHKDSLDFLVGRRQGRPPATASSASGA